MGDEGVKFSEIATEITAINPTDRLAALDNSGSITAFVQGANLWTNESGDMTIKNASEGDNISITAEKAAAGGTVVFIFCDPDIGQISFMGNASAGLSVLLATNTSLIGRTGTFFIRNFADGENMVFTADNAGGTSQTMLTLDPDGPEQLVLGTIKIKEQAAANADTAAYGQFWVKNDTPCTPWFTDDAGTDHQLAYV
jgi:hypothetical protein